MSNSEEVLKRLNKRCQGRDGNCSRAKGGRHRHAEGSITAGTAIFPFGLCRAILHGCRSQLVADGRLVLGVIGIQRPEETMAERELEKLCQKYMTLVIEVNAVHGEPAFKDAITGQSLRPEMVKAARREEMEYFAAKRVWKKVPRRLALELQGKPPIRVKWLDTNKGDDESPNYRSRLVACEVRQPWEDSIFAPTPGSKRSGVCCPSLPRTSRAEGST